MLCHKIKCLDDTVYMHVHHFLECKRDMFAHVPESHTKSRLFYTPTEIFGGSMTFCRISFRLDDVWSNGTFGRYDVLSDMTFGRIRQLVENMSKFVQF